MPDSTPLDTAPLRRIAIGSLIRRAREAADRTQKDTARYVGLSTKRLAAFETGEREPSLAELEALAYYLDVPVLALVSDEAAKGVQPKAAPDFKSLTSLRSKIIGAHLKQARLAQGVALKDAAATFGLTPGLLTGYEQGRSAMPITLLEKMMTHYGLTVEQLLDLGIGPVGEAQLHLKQREQFDLFAENLRAFVGDPASRAYLELAMHLSRLPKEQLHGAARVLELAAAAIEA